MKDQRKTKAQLIEELTDLRTRLAALEESDGEARYRSVIAEDITERKRAEEALRESEERFRLALKNSPITVFSQDRDLRFTWVYNPPTGFDAESLLGKTDRELLGPDQADEPTALKLRVLETGQPVREELSFLIDGETRWFDLSVEPQRDASGIGVACVTIDVTERRRAEEALRKYKSMVSASRDLMVLVDPTYTYEAVNAAYCEAHGKTEEQVLGHTVASVLGKTMFETTLKPNLDRCLAGERMRFEFWWDSPALGRRHVDARYDPFYEADGSVSGVLVDIRDDTERQYAQEELRKSHESLRNLATRLQSVREEERAVLAREVHEELGQALVGLKMDLAWLTGRLPVDQEPLQMRARAMASLIDSTFSTVRKIATGLRPAMLDDLGLEAAIEWQTTEFEQRAEIRCEVHLDAGEIVPSHDRDTALFRIFQEALTNIGRHAEASHVRVTLRSNAGELVLVVSDDGKGISADQIASHKSLGLIGMRERAGALGGEVEIQPGPEGCTRVTTTVPLGVR